MPFCCNPLTVARGKKLRLVFDLHHVNAYLHERKFRYKNLKTLEKFLRRVFICPHWTSKMAITTPKFTTVTQAT